MKIKTLWTVFTLLFFCILKGYSQCESQGNLKNVITFNHPPMNDYGFKDHIGLPKDLPHSDHLFSSVKVSSFSFEPTYEADFSLAGEKLEKGTKAFVLFKDVQEMVRVFVNGNDCGIAWTPPYKANITPYLKTSQNKITVQVINTWNNRIVGDLNNPSEKYSNTNIRSKFKKNSPLLKSGLMGKAEIFFIE